MRLKLTRLVASLIAVSACAVAGLTFAAPSARSDDAPTAMLIIDGSGSMWGRLGPANRPKIDLVRDKLGAVLANATSAHVGLVAFGHRRRGDCNDVELIATPDSPIQGLLDPIAKLNPRGPGPVTAALRTAVGAIGQSRPAQIIIVGDNADNCRQDSCAAAQEIAKTAPGVAVQVIGIGVPANERPRLACIAEATGGRFYDITDSDGLNAALDETTKLAMLSPGAVAGAESAGRAEKPAAPPPPAGASLRVSAALAEDGALLDVPLNWRIYKADGATVLLQRIGKDITAKLDAGDYVIEAALGDIKVRHPVAIADGVAQSIIVPLDASHLVARPVATKGGPLLPTAIVTVSSSESPVSISRGGVADLYLKPGEYHVTVADGAARSAETLSLATGDAKTLDIALASGLLKVSATGPNGSALQDVLYTVDTDDPESPDGRREVARSRSPDASFTLPEGTYYLGAISGNGSVSKRIAIGAGQTVTDKLPIVLVPVSISALIAGTPARADENIFYRVDRIDGDRVSIARTIGPGTTLDLSPGRYRISASIASAHLAATKELTVEAGKPAKAVIDIASGQVNFVPAANAAPTYGDISWEVADENGMPIWRANGTDATAILAPGRYTVRFDARNSHGEASFEVQAGQTQKIEIGPG
ncbi:MAG: VWA domain-containing protein [Hyphomicrobium sp.]|uniref:vWA domain-containing protein n=1 Tax=Hyphomicrobium sp. TaxID=82 RepID=UPI0039E3B4AD